MLLWILTDEILARFNSAARKNFREDRSEVLVIHRYQLPSDVYEVTNILKMWLHDTSKNKRKNYQIFVFARFRLLNLCLNAQIAIQTIQTEKSCGKLKRTTGYLNFRDFCFLQAKEIGFIEF